MKGIAICIFASISILLMAIILSRGCSTGIETSHDPPDRSSRTASRLRLSERPHPQPAMPRQSAAIADPATTFQQPPDETISAETSIKTTGEATAIAFPNETSATGPVDSQIDQDLQLTLDQTGESSTSLRNADFPRTYISLIRVSLTSPNHWVRLTWSGPDAASQHTGPFHSSPGRGLGNNNCDDVDESNRDGSNCTPKGTMQVQGFSASMPSHPHCRFVTWFQVARGVAFHYYPNVPNYPASHGCVRLNEHAAQLIHNNSKIGATEVIVDGQWEFMR